MNGRTLRWLLALARGSALRGRAPRLVVLRHHRVYDDGAAPLDRLGISAAVFRAQLEMLARAGLVPVSVAEGIAHLDRGDPGARVALSFDDGYADNHARALPLLRAAGARATFFLTAGLMERREAPWWDEVADAFERSKAALLVWDGAGATMRLPLAGRADRRRAMAAVLPDFRADLATRARRIGALRAALGVEGPVRCELMGWSDAAALRDAGMEIGAHTMTHPHLTTLAPGDQAAEIADSVALIEQRLGVRPAGFAYPGGDYDARTLDAVRAAGLAYAVTTRAGENRAGSPRLELKRRGLPDGACLGPGGAFAPRLAMAEIAGAFDGMRALRAEAAR
ncbi:MAG: polysaccharide deacetylase family protein [Candidatus Eisenbacteria bacterium]|uniref:Polysaccharide deacetylase family protein n=1 Tax=Eiseniibacteriota bacterium TaxID=2212470 RepID=A0A9D6QJP4_UNCEI|nr:polysaccharide deacetylase family protein [Candidatus Eisenbacteria bacterium]MBI3539376.1 polysaccharide deacetylase family protein [Candidatus Eisenbacteria bacterium]